MIQGVLSGGCEAIDCAGAQIMQAAIEVLPDFVGEVLFVHSEIPFAFKAAASACVAREQCVFTLPSEQPIAEAVSATSMSSQ